jgi:hypothetical protein
MVVRTTLPGRAPPGRKQAIAQFHQKRAGEFEDLVGLAQLFVLAFKLLQALQLGRRDAGPGAVVDLIALDPFVEGLGHAADLWGEGFDGGPQRGVVAAVLTHHANSPFADLGGKLV